MWTNNSSPLKSNRSTKYSRECPHTHIHINTHTHARIHHAYTHTYVRVHIAQENKFEMREDPPRLYRKSRWSNILQGISAATTFNSLVLLYLHIRERDWSNISCDIAI